MAILKDFIDQVSFPEVWALLGGGQQMEEYREAYESILRDLKAAQPQENTGNMTIRFVEETESEWSFYFDDAEETQEEQEEPTLQVYGFIPGDPEGYAIGMKSPEALVGLDVDPETEKNYTPAEIVAHCIAEMTYNSTLASSAYGMEKDMAGGGLLASQSCMSEDIQNVDLNKLRESLGVLPEHEDYKKKYGFLF